MLYSLVAVVPVLGSSKFRTACEHPGPKAKAGGVGATGMTGGGGSRARTRGAAAAAAWAGGAVYPWSIFPYGGCA